MGRAKPGQVSREEISRIHELLLTTGSDPEHVIGKCPKCGEVFEYNHGKITGHLLSHCPKRIV